MAKIARWRRDRFRRDRGAVAAPVAAPVAETVNRSRSRPWRRAVTVPTAVQAAVQAAAPVPEQAAAQAAEIASEVSETGRPRDQRRLARSLGTAARSAARVAGRGTRAARRGAGLGSGWLVSQATAMAPRLRVRDRAALAGQFPGLPAEELADALIESAARASAAVGGAVGVWAALPALPAFPAEVAAETLALVGIEVKLVAELHEAYGLPAPGNVVDRMTAYLHVWAQRRSVMLGPAGVVVATSSPLAHLLRRRLAARAGRSVFSLGPLLTGAAAGALINRRETRRLGQEIRTDLRRRGAAISSAHATQRPRGDPGQ